MEPILLRADRAGERADQLLARLVPELTRSATCWRCASRSRSRWTCSPRPSPWTWRMRTPT